jgi:hypothetical protein
MQSIHRLLGARACFEAHCLEFGFDLLDILCRLLEHALRVGFEAQHLPRMRGRDAYFERGLQLTRSSPGDGVRRAAVHRD